MFLAVGRVNSESSKLTNGDRQKEVIIATEGAVQSGGTWWAENPAVGLLREWDRS